MMEKITLPAIKLKLQDPKEGAEMWIELNDKYIRYKADFLANEPTDRDDLAMPWEIQRTDISLLIKPQFISGLEMTLLEDPKVYRIALMTVGFGDDLKIFFKRKSEAQELYDKLEKYITEC